MCKRRFEFKNQRTRPPRGIPGSGVMGWQPRPIMAFRVILRLTELFATGGGWQPRPIMAFQAILRLTELFAAGV